MFENSIIPNREIAIAEKGQTDGVAPLDAQGFVPNIHLPARGHELFSHVSQYWYDQKTFHAVDRSRNTNFSANVLRAVPIQIFGREEVDFDAIGIRNTDSGGASVCRLGIYTNDPLTMSPKDLIVDAGEAPLNTATPKVIAINQQLDPGVYWLAMVNNQTRRFRAWDEIRSAGLLGRLDLNSQETVAYRSAPLTYGPLPAAFPTPITDVFSDSPQIALRVA